MYRNVSLVFIDLYVHEWTAMRGSGAGVVYPNPADNSVAYLGAADNVSGPLASRLSRVNQPVIRTRNTFSTLLPSLLADI
jgi:hypothetical protein